MLIDEQTMIQPLAGLVSVRLRHLLDDARSFSVRGSFQIRGVQLVIGLTSQPLVGHAASMIRRPSHSPTEAVTASRELHSGVSPGRSPSSHPGGLAGARIRWG